MGLQPQIQLRAALSYAGISMPVTMADLPGAVDAGFPELFGWLAEHGIAPTGAPFIRFLVIDMQAELQIEMGAPVGVPVPDDGRVRPGVLPAGRYVTLRHVGPYDGLIASNAALQQWAREQGIEFDSWDTGRGSGWRGRFEQYLTDPSSEPDPAKWETEVAYLIREG